MIDRDELVGVAAPRSSTPGVGREAARRLLAAFGSPQRCSTPRPRRARRGRLTPRRRRWRRSRRAVRRAARRDRLAGMAGRAATERRDVVALGDPRYPQRCSKPPTRRLLLYVRRPDRAARRPTRSPSSAAATRRAQGLENARAFASHLSRAGLVSSSRAWRSASTAPRTRAPWTSPRRAGTIARRRHRARRRLPGPAPRAGAPDRRRRACWSANSRSAPPSLAGELPDQEPHHRRPGARHRWWSRRRCSSGSLITARLAARGRPRGVRDSRLDPFAAGARLPRAASSRAPSWSTAPHDILDELSARSPGAGAAAPGRSSRARPAEPTRCSPPLGFDPIEPRRARRPHRHERRRAVGPRCSISSSPAASPACPGSVFQRRRARLTRDGAARADAVHPRRRASAKERSGIVDSCSMCSCTSTRTTGAPTRAPSTSS